MKRAVSLLLCLVTVFLLCATAYAKDYTFVSDTGVELQYPKLKYYYEVPLFAIVQSGRKNGSIYIMPRPEAGNGHLGTVPDGELVVILAEKDGYYFFETLYGYRGWNGKGWFEIDSYYTEYYDLDTYGIIPPTSFPLEADGYSTVSDKGVSLEYPSVKELYSVPFVMYVSSYSTEKRGAIYLMPRPEKGNGNLGRIADWNAVLVIAERGDFFFFVTEDGRYGWNAKKWFYS